MHTPMRTPALRFVAFFLFAMTASVNTATPASAIDSPRGGVNGGRKPERWAGAERRSKSVAPFKRDLVQTVEVAADWGGRQAATPQLSLTCPHS